MPIKDKYSKMDLTPAQRYRLRHPERRAASDKAYENSDKGKARIKRYRQRKKNAN